MVSRDWGEAVCCMVCGCVCGLGRALRQEVVCLAGSVSCCVAYTSDAGASSAAATVAYMWCASLLNTPSLPLCCTHTPTLPTPAHTHPHIQSHTPLTHTHAQASGRLQRKLAHRVQIPPQQQQQPAASEAAAGVVSSSSSSRFGASGRFCRAHRLSPTAVALSADECIAFTVSKDGSILRWDLETMKRTQLIR